MAETIGPFEILGELGRGAMAVVWRAYDPTLDREVALKEAMLPPGLSDAAMADMSERFVREAKTAARLNHPGIVTIHNAAVYDGHPVIVMELIPGDTLGTVLCNGPLDEMATTVILDQLLDAVGYAHANGIVHRDLKPDNVFLLPDGRIKVADFGIAHVNTASTLTQAGTVMGTPGYMAPEQITGGQVDARTDLFSIGVIGYEMLVGGNPFGVTSGESTTTVMYKVVHTDVPTTSQLLPSTSPALSETLRAAMSKDPASRFESAAAMREALRGGPIPAPGSGAPGGVATVPAPVGPQKSRTGLLVTVAVAAVLVVGAVGLFLSATKPPAAGVTPTAAAAASTSTTQDTIPAASTSTAPETTPAEPTGPTEAELKASAAQTIQDWKSAWESMDLNTYMDFYASDFYSKYKHFDRAGWRSWKADVFSRYSYQQVGISGMKVKVAGDRATVTFRQGFKSDSVGGGAGYSDVGNKTMYMKWTGSRWLITGEEWR